MEKEKRLYKCKAWKGFKAEEKMKSKGRGKYNIT